MKTKTKPAADEQEVARKAKLRHALFLAALAFDHERRFESLSKSERVRAKAFYLDAIIKQRAEDLGVHVTRKRDLTAQTLGAIVLAMRRNLEKDGIRIPRAGKKPAQNGAALHRANVQVLHEMLAKLRVDYGYTDAQISQLVRRQTKKPALDYGDPKAVNQVLGAARAILRNLDKRSAA